MHVQWTWEAHATPPAAQHENAAICEVSDLARQRNYCRSAEQFWRCQGLAVWSQKRVGHRLYFEKSERDFELPWSSDHSIMPWIWPMSLDE